jgi:hypothetical protein
MDMPQLRHRNWRLVAPFIRLDRVTLNPIGGRGVAAHLDVFAQHLVADGAPLGEQRLDLLERPACCPRSRSSDALPLARFRARSPRPQPATAARRVALATLLSTHVSARRAPCAVGDPGGQLQICSASRESVVPNKLGESVRSARRYLYRTTFSRDRRPALLFRRHERPALRQLDCARASASRPDVAVPTLGQ